MVNVRGLSRDLIIHPGETLKEALVEKQMTQKELAARTGRSEVQVSRVVTGAPITPDFAKKLEYVLDIPAYFWNNIQKNYDQELADYKDRHSISENEQRIYVKIKNVLEQFLEVLGLEPEKDEVFGIVQARKFLKVANLGLITEPELSVAYRTANYGKTDEHINYVWNKLCDAHLEKYEAKPFLGIEKLMEVIPEIKSMMFEKNINCSVKNLQNLFSDLGVRFAVVRHYKGAPHHGRVSRNSKDGIDICVTIRQGRVDIFWFSLFHEIAHILNGDLDKEIYSAKDDLEANRLAESLLIPCEDYNKFKQQADFSLSSIIEFAKRVGVPSFTVIGRLQNDKLLRWSSYRKQIRYLKWKDK